MMRWLLWSLSLLIALPLWGGEVDELIQKKESLKSDVERLNNQISQVDSLTAQEISRFQLLQSRHTQDQQRRSAEIAELDQKIRDALKKQEVERSRQNSFVAKGDEITRRHQYILTKLKEQCRHLESLISRTIPWEREERLERTRSLCRDLEAESPTAEEGFSRLSALLAEEVRFGDEIALVRGTIVRNDGETVNATILRLGNQSMLYMDDQEKKFGILDRVNNSKNGEEWRWREELSFTERDAVRRALEVKGTRRPPELVVLTIGTLLQRPADEVISSDEVAP